jgi:hypothetical protein
VNNENLGSKLEIQDNHTDAVAFGSDTIGLILEEHSKYTEMLEHQRPTGKAIELHPEDFTIAELSQFMMYMSHCLNSEIQELIDSLGGEEDGIGSGGWKMWKTSHAKAKIMKIKDLSDRDKQNIKMEIADMMHFFLSMAMAVGMDEKDLFNYFMCKSKENQDRQVRGY